jgi:hypothetical protein
MCHEQDLVFIPIRNKGVRTVTSADRLYSYWFSMKKIIFTSYVLFSSFDLDLNLNMRPATRFDFSQSAESVNPHLPS